MHGLDTIPATLGVPEWWPTGSRVSAILAHGAQKEDPLLQYLQEQLTERKLLTLRFHFPYVEAGKKRPDSNAVMLRVFRAAIGLLGRDPTAAPAHIFLGGKNIGALAAAHAGTARLRLDGLFLLGFPLHKQGNTDELRTERLFRVISPILFATGTRDRHCDLDVLRRISLRIGAPTVIHPVEDADHAFKVTKKGPREQEEVDQEILTTVEAWIQKILGE